MKLICRHYRCTNRRCSRYGDVRVVLPSFTADQVVIYGEPVCYACDTGEAMERVPAPESSA